MDIPHSTPLYDIRQLKHIFATPELHERLLYRPSPNAGWQQSAALGVCNAVAEMMNGLEYSLAPAPEPRNRTQAEIAALGDIWVMQAGADRWSRIIAILDDGKLELSNCFSRQEYITYTADHGKTWHPLQTTEPACETPHANS